MNIQDFSFEENLFDSQSAVKKTVKLNIIIYQIEYYFSSNTSPF